MPVFKVVAANTPLIFPPQSPRLTQGFLSLCTTTAGNQKPARTGCKNKHGPFFLLFLKKMRKTLGQQLVLFPHRASPPPFFPEAPPAFSSPSAQRYFIYTDKIVRIARCGTSHSAGLSGSDDVIPLWVSCPVPTAQGGFGHPFQPPESCCCEHPRAHQHGSQRCLLRLLGEPTKDGAPSSSGRAEGSTWSLLLQLQPPTRVTSTQSPPEIC